MRGQFEIRFLARKISEVEPIGMHFGPIIGGSKAHKVKSFHKWKVLVSREKFDFRQKFGIRLFFYSGQRGALCELLLPADTKTSCISIRLLQTKAVCTACVWVQKTQLCIQQLKSGLHCTYSVVTHMWRSYVRRVWGLISMVGGLAPQPPLVLAPEVSSIFTYSYIAGNANVESRTNVTVE